MSHLIDIGMYWRVKMNKNRQYQDVGDEKDIEIVECCSSCEYVLLGYGGECHCSKKKYKRYYLGANHMDTKSTQPHYKCKLYKMDKYTKKFIKHREEKWLNG